MSNPFDNVPSSANVPEVPDKKDIANLAELVSRIEQLDHWYEDNAEAVAFGQFYRENFTKQYRDWQTGRWQQDIDYRDSLRHSLSRLKRLYSPAD